ncbi:hypothetical protein PSPO01_08727 [Paraphaeosphaeria sporulosa]
MDLPRIFEQWRRVEAPGRACAVRHSDDVGPISGSVREEQNAHGEAVSRAALQRSRAAGVCDGPGMRSAAATDEEPLETLEPGWTCPFGTAAFSSPPATLLSSITATRPFEPCDDYYFLYLF